MVFSTAQAVAAPVIIEAPEVPTELETAELASAPEIVPCFPAELG